MTKKDKNEFNALRLIAYKRAGINYPAMQQGQPYAQVALPQSHILTAVKELLPKKDVLIQIRAWQTSLLWKRLGIETELSVMPST